MSETYKQSVTISKDHKPALDYLSNRLGVSRTAVLAQILDESIPQLYYMVKNAEQSLDGNPKEIALVHALKTVTNFLEGGKT